MEDDLGMLDVIVIMAGPLGGGGGGTTEFGEGGYGDDDDTNILYFSPLPDVGGV